MTRRHFASAAVIALLAAPLPPRLHAQERPLSPTEIQALIARVVANQHRDDAALMEYERIERKQVRKTASAPPIEENAYRVVPTGTGTVRVQVEAGGRAVDAELYRKQLRGLEHALENSNNPTLARQKQDEEKFAKRMRERTGLVDAARDAFRYTWLGRETHNGRTLVKLALQPNPDYKPTSRNTNLFAHVRATAWVDEAAAQLVRGEAEITSDISFGGGILGKVYRGGKFALEQAEVAPGVWLPTRYEYDYGGRKFVFGFDTHELTLVSGYRRIGPPKEALAAIRRELSTGASPGVSRTDP